MGHGMSSLYGYRYGAGHWKTCRNGHPFHIEECGMLTEESRCIECGARIGGSGHQLRSDNRRA